MPIKASIKDFCMERGDGDLCKDFKVSYIQKKCVFGAISSKLYQESKWYIQLDFSSTFTLLQ